MAIGRVKIGWAAAWGADLSFQDAAMSRAGDMAGVDGPAVHAHHNDHSCISNNNPIGRTVNINDDDGDDGDDGHHNQHNHGSNLNYADYANNNINGRSAIWWREMPGTHITDMPNAKVLSST